MELYFQNSRGETRKIAELPYAPPGDARFQAASKEIKKFCEERNFKIFYTRFWNELVDDREMTIFDVGSHTEFFLLCPAVYPEKEEAYDPDSEI